MLQKLRSRHPIDLPADGFGHKKAIVAVLGGIAFLFVLVPFLLSPLAALYRATGARGGVVPVVVAIGVGFGVLVLVLLGAAARGKVGANR